MSSSKPPNITSAEWNAVFKVLRDAESAIAGEVIQLWEEGKLHDAPYALARLIRTYVDFKAAINGKD